MRINDAAASSSRMRSHLYRPLQKLLDVVNVPVAYSFDYACQLITIPARQTRDARGGGMTDRGWKAKRERGNSVTRGTDVQTQGIIGTTYRANKLALARH